MTKKHIYTWKDIETMCTNIVLQMYRDHFTPSKIVGITRGGNIPATIISNMTGIPCEALKVSLRDDDIECEHNEKLAEFAGNGLGVLVVDDINDTGATFNWIKKDWQEACLPNSQEWNTVWGNNVRWAVLTDNLASKFEHKINYTCDEVNKAEEDVWLVYPWENVGEYHA